MRRRFSLLFLLQSLVLLAVLAAGTAQAALISSFSFMSSSGTTTADSITGGTAALINGATVSGGALVLGNTGQTGTAGQYANLTTDVATPLKSLTTCTFEGYANITTMAQWARIFDFGTGQANYIAIAPQNNNSDPWLNLLVNNGAANTITGSTTLTATGNHYFAVTFSPSGANYTESYYVDGSLIGSILTTVTPSSLGTTTLDYLGCSQFNDPNLRGSISDFRIWNNALSAAQVSANYSAGAKGLAVWNGSGDFAANATNWDLQYSPSGAMTAYVNSGSMSLSTTTGYTGGTWIAGGLVTVASTATLGGNVAGANNNITLSGGSLALGSASNIGSNQGLVLYTGGALDTQGFALAPVSLTLSGGTLSSNAGGSLSVLGSGGFAVQSGLISGNLAGTGGMVKSTAGTVILSGSNNYNGGTQINAGILQFSNSNALPAGANSITINPGGMLAATGAYSTVNAWLAGGTIGASSSGAIALTSSSPDTFIDFTTSPGYNGLSLGAVGAVTYGGTINPGTSGYLLGGGPGGALTLQQSLTGASNLTASGPGSVTLAAAPTYTGSTAVTGGTLALAAASSLSGNVSVSGGTLNVAAATTFNGNNTVSNGLLALAAPTTANGNTTITGGVIDLGTNTLSTSATVTFGAGTVQDGTINNTGSYAGQGGTVSALLSGSAALTKTTTGTLVLTNAGNSYAGGTNVNGGVLNFAAGALGTSGPIAFGGGTLQWNANTQDLSSRFAAIASGQAAILDTNGNNVVFASVLTGSGGLTKSGGAGSLTLLGSNTYSGVTTLSAGTLVAGNVQSFGTNSTAAALTLNAGVVDLQTNTSINHYNTTIAGATTILSDVATLGEPGIAQTFGTLSINANTLTNGSGSNVIFGAAAVSFGAVTLTGAATINTNAGAGTTLASVAGGTNALTIGGAGNTTIAGNAVSGTLYKSGAGTLAITGNMAVTGDIFPHAGVLLLSNGTLTSTAYSSFGQVSGDNPTVILQGNSKLAVNSDFNVSDVAGTAGTMTLQNSSTAQGVNTYVGKTSATGVLNVQNSAVMNATGYLGVGCYTTGVGIVNLTSGTIQMGNGDNRVGGYGSAADVNAYGNVNISAGLMNAGNYNYQIGAYGIGVQNQTGGVFTCGVWGPDLGRYVGGRGLYNISGGTINQTGTGNRLIVGEVGTGVLNVSGNAQLNLSGGLWISLNDGGSGVGYVNLSGGTVTTPFVNADAGGLSLLNLAGGTIRASAASTTFIGAASGASALTGVYIYPGGATIDTQANADTIAQSVLGPTGYGVGSIAITASGVGYKGEPFVTLTGGSGSGATARAIVNPASGVITGIVITNPGSGYGAGDVLTATLAGGGASTAATLGTVTVVPNSNTGGLTKLSSGTLTLSSSDTYGGPTTISGGVLVLGNTGSLLNSTLNYNNYGGSVNFGTLTSATLGGLSGSQALALPTNFALSLGTNNSTYSGALERHQRHAHQDRRRHLRPRRHEHVQRHDDHQGRRAGLRQRGTQRHQQHHFRRRRARSGPAPKTFPRSSRRSPMAAPPAWTRAATT